MIPKVSVIVPVFNACAHIERCCHSLFSQNLEELEIIFVDDCSYDDSINIIKTVLDKYPQRKAQTKILSHDINKGVGAARYTGNKSATGKYIIHCDADDYVDIDMYNKMYEAAENNNADVVMCDYVCGKKIFKINPYDIEHPDFDISPINGAVWNKLISRELISRYAISFDSDLILGEDFLYIMQCRILANKVLYLPDALYHYSVENDGSITRHFNQQKCESIVNVAKRMELFLRIHGLSEKFSFELNYLKYQAKSFYLLFPETRNLKLYNRLFCECENQVTNYSIAGYRKLCSMLICNHLSWVALGILKFRDLRMHKLC